MRGRAGRGVGRWQGRVARSPGAAALLLLLFLLPPTPHAAVQRPQQPQRPTQHSTASQNPRTTRTPPTQRRQAGGAGQEAVQEPGCRGAGQQPAAHGREPRGAAGRVVEVRAASPPAHPTSPHRPASPRPPSCPPRSRKTLIYLILTLNHIYPDYDFSLLRAHHFRKEEGILKAEEAVDSHLLEVSKVRAQRQGAQGERGGRGMRARARMRPTMRRGCVHPGRATRSTAHAPGGCARCRFGPKRPALEKTRSWRACGLPSKRWALCRRHGPVH